MDTLSFFSLRNIGYTYFDWPNGKIYILYSYEKKNKRETETNKIKVWLSRLLQKFYLLLSFPLFRKLFTIATRRFRNQLLVAARNEPRHERPASFDARHSVIINISKCGRKHRHFIHDVSTHNINQLRIDLSCMPCELVCVCVCVSPYECMHACFLCVCVAVCECWQRAKAIAVCFCFELHNARIESYEKMALLIQKCTILEWLVCAGAAKRVYSHWSCVVWVAAEERKNTRRA